MSREIKFRVWQKRIKEYETQNRFFLCQFDGLYEWDGQQLTAISISRDDYVVEQYTGFNDSEGKEIYEGDITETISEMVFMESGLKSGTISKSIHEILFFEGEWCHKVLTRSDWTGNFEPYISRGLTIHAKYTRIIGNCHEAEHTAENGK